MADICHTGGVRESGGGFFDGESCDPTVPPRIVLERVAAGDAERFRVLRRIGYRTGDVQYIIPDDPLEFTSDLTSVPHLFTWLIPRTGRHLPAALLHDALVAGAQSGTVRIGRLEADHLFRDAMGDLGTSLLRRWLMWAAVVIASIHRGAVAPVWWWRTLLYGTVTVILALGVLTTLDIADVIAVVPWLGERPLGTELLVGAIAAVMIPAVLALCWGRLWLVAAICGWALAVLLYATVLLVVLSALFVVIEALAGALQRALVGRGRRELAAGSLGREIEPTGGGQFHR